MCLQLKNKKIKAVSTKIGILCKVVLFFTGSHDNQLLEYLSSGLLHVCKHMLCVQPSIYNCVYIFHLIYIFTSICLCVYFKDKS